jgi:arylsulfatase
MQVEFSAMVCRFAPPWGGETEEERAMSRDSAKLFAVLVLSVAFASGLAAAERPNVLIILADDMGFSDLGCYGGEIQTPNLDRLAAGGLRFTQFYNTARCCPTRASLLTGLYPHQAGVGHMVEDRGREGYRGNLNRTSVTLAEVMRTAGYRTYMVGKWHVALGKNTGPDGPKDTWPLQRGFDRFYGTIQGAGSFFDPHTLTRDNTFISPYADPEYKPERFYYTDALSDHAARFIREHRRDHGAKPLFMYLAYTAAHWPMHALEKDIAKYKGMYDAGYGPVRQARLERMRKLGLIDPKWELTPQANSWEKVPDRAWESRCMEVYAAMIDNMDQGIGRIVAELERQGQLDNTLILFLQDNGGCAEGLGRAGDKKRPERARADKPTLSAMKPEELQRAMIPAQTRDGWPVLVGKKVLPGPPDTYIAYGQGWANVSNTPFREYKHWVHEGGISTPLIAHWPARTKAKGELRPQPGHLIDLMATCVDVGGAKYPLEFHGHKITPMEGRSLVPAFDNRAIDREAIFWEHEGNRAIRVGDWKLVAKGPAGAWELYDLKADRTEMHDLAGKHPEKVKELIAKWEAWAKRAKVIPWIWEPQYGR